MYNEAANLAHRAGLHYDSSGAMGPFHLRVALTAGAEGAGGKNRKILILLKIDGMFLVQLIIPGQK